MLNILGQFRNTARIQFTGKDLKTWYAKFGKDKIYICSVIHYIFKEQTALSGYYPNSNNVIKDMRELVPIRFKKPVSWSMTIDNNLKSKYVSNKPGATSEWVSLQN